MRAQSLVDSLFARYSAGLPFLPISGGDGSPDVKPPEVKPPETPPPDLGKIVADALAKHGDQTAALKAFASDLYASRDDNRALRAKLPAEGAIVLSGDDAKDWGAYRTIGKPSDLRKTVEEHGTLSAENGSLKWDGVLRGVAEKTGSNFAVLKRLAAPGLVFESKPVKDAKTGKETEVLHVRDGDKLPVPFDDYAAKEWAEFLPALRPAAKAEEARPNATPNRREFNPLNPTIPFAKPAEGGTNQAAPETVSTRHLASIRNGF